MERLERIMICSEIGTKKGKWARKERTLVEDRITEISGDRRDNRRYGVELPLTYTVLHNGRTTARGTGTTIDISSGGMSFLPEAKLEPGVLVQVVVEWPAIGEGGRTMELAVTGRVLRSEGGAAAIRNVNREFRAQTSPLAMAAAGR